jgi:TfoX/Sxy family transcriptional regulator of competence genes
MPKMTKSPAELVARFDELTRLVPDATRRPMFGYPSCTLNGHMFMSLFQDSMVLRLGDADRSEVIDKLGGASFEPMPGRPMTGYVVLPADLVADDARIAPWIRKAHDHAASLPPKKPKAKKS